MSISYDDNDYTPGTSNLVQLGKGCQQSWNPQEQAHLNFYHVQSEEKSTAEEEE